MGLGEGGTWTDPFRTSLVPCDAFLRLVLITPPPATSPSPEIHHPLTFNIDIGRACDATARALLSTRGRR